MALFRKNVTNHVIIVQHRRLVVNLCLTLGIIFWSGVVSGIQRLTSVNTIAMVRNNILCCVPLLFVLASFSFLTIYFFNIWWVVIKSWLVYKKLPLSFYLFFSWGTGVTQ